MENWKDDIMNSLQGMKKAEPTANLFENIQQRLDKKKTETVFLPLPQWTSVTAVLLMVIGINAYMISQHFKSNQVNEQTDQFYIGSTSDYNLYEP